MALGDERPASKVASGAAARSFASHASRSPSCSTRSATGGGSTELARKARAPPAGRDRSSALRSHAGVDATTASSREDAGAFSASRATLRRTALANAATRGPLSARTDATASLTAAKAGTRVKKSWYAATTSCDRTCASIDAIPRGACLPTCSSSHGSTRRLP